MLPEGATDSRNPAEHILPRQYTRASAQGQRLPPRPPLRWPAPELHWARFKLASLEPLPLTNGRRRLRRRAGRAGLVQGVGGVIAGFAPHLVLGEAVEGDSSPRSPAPVTKETTRSKPPGAASACKNETPAERLVLLAKGRGFLRDRWRGLHPHFVFRAALSPPAPNRSQTCLWAIFKALIPSEAETLPQKRLPLLGRSGTAFQGKSGTRSQRHQEPSGLPS